MREGVRTAFSNQERPDWDVHLVRGAGIQRHIPRVSMLRQKRREVDGVHANREPTVPRLQSWFLNRAYAVNAVA